MVEEPSDLALIRGYLLGARAANAVMESYIAAALSAWQHKIDTTTGEVLSDIRYKLLMSLRNNEFQFRSTVKTYIARIVNHTCIDYLRYNKKFSDCPPEELPLSDQSPNPEDKLQRRQAAKIVFRVLRQVPRECIRLWHMHLKKEMSYREIGEIMGKSEGNIRRRLWACREAAKDLREKIVRKDKPF